MNFEMTKTTRPLLTPPVPRLLNAPMAAAYLSLAARTFEYKWRAGVLPEPIRIGRRLAWDRKVLDNFVDTLSGLGKYRSPRAKGWENI